jgi:hypothetical protein
LEVTILRDWRFLAVGGADDGASVPSAVVQMAEVVQFSGFAYPNFLKNIYRENPDIEPFQPFQP